jgi:hypothetical protein
LRILFSGVWRFARRLTVYSPSGEASRSFLGFLEPLSLTEDKQYLRKKPFIVPKERYRLISEPGEDFYEGKADTVSCEGEVFELLTIKPLWAAGRISHRECILVRTGGGDWDGQ